MAICLLLDQSVVAAGFGHSPNLVCAVLVLLRLQRLRTISSYRSSCAVRAPKYHGLKLTVTVRVSETRLTGAH